MFMTVPMSFPMFMLVMFMGVFMLIILMLLIVVIVHNCVPLWSVLATCNICTPRTSNKYDTCFYRELPDFSLLAFNLWMIRLLTTIPCWAWMRMHQQAKSKQLLRNWPC